MPMEPNGRVSTATIGPGGKGDVLTETHVLGWKKGS